MNKNNLIGPSVLRFLYFSQLKSNSGKGRQWHLFICPNLCHAKCRSCGSLTWQCNWWRTVWGLKSRNIGYVLLAVCLATTRVLAHMECMTRSVVAYSWTCHRCVQGKRPFNVHTSQLRWLIMEIIGLWFKVEKPEVLRKPFVLSNWISLPWLKIILVLNNHILFNECVWSPSLMKYYSLFLARSDYVLRNEIPFWYEITMILSMY